MDYAWDESCLCAGPPHTLLYTCAGCVEGAGDSAMVAGMESIVSGTANRLCAYPTLCSSEYVWCSARGRLRNVLRHRGTRRCLRPYRDVLDRVPTNLRISGISNPEIGFLDSSTGCLRDIPDELQRVLLHLGARLVWRCRWVCRELGHLDLAAADVHRIIIKCCSGQASD